MWVDCCFLFLLLLLLLFANAEMYCCLSTADSQYKSGSEERPVHNSQDTPDKGLWCDGDDVTLCFPASVTTRITVRVFTKCVKRDAVCTSPVLVPLLLLPPGGSPGQLDDGGEGAGLHLRHGGRA